MSTSVVKPVLNSAASSGRDEGDMAQAQGQPGFRVLYIEDNPANLMLMRVILSRRPGIELEVAEDGALGVQAAAREPPHLIFLDMNLPQLSGLQVMALLQQEEATKNVPVVAISANAMPEDIKAAKAAGCVDYVVKPYLIDRVLEVLDQAMARSST